MFKQALDIQQILLQFKFRVSKTWLLVVFENSLLALLPLFLGYAIDDLLTGGIHDLAVVASLLLGLTIIGVIRRLYDTRTYGSIRVAFASAVHDRHQHSDISTRNARLDMSRELVDFLENEVPELLTACIQILVTLTVLASFHSYLAISALTMTVVMITIYALFHKRFCRLNTALNTRLERQVRSLSRGPLSVRKHLHALRNVEVKISDTEAIVYGLIFLFISAFVIFNLWQATHLIDLSPGKIFSIISYSWDYVGAALVLPMALQSWTHLHEITHRLNAI